MSLKTIAPILAILLASAGTLLAQDCPAEHRTAC